MNTQTDAMYKTWEYRGIEIKPLSRARKFHLSKLVDFQKISPWDIAVLLFALTCKKSVMLRGLRDQAFFDAEVSEWIDKEEIDVADLDDSVMNLIKEIMEHSDSNRAAPIQDPSMMPDPMGNG